METKRPDCLKELVPAGKIQKILDLAFKIQTKGIANVFFNFSAHISQVELVIYLGGWHSGMEGERKAFYVDVESYSQKRIDDILEDLTDIYNSNPSYEKICEAREAKELERKRAQYEKLKAEFES